MPNISSAITAQGINTRFQFTVGTLKMGSEGPDGEGAIAWHLNAASLPLYDTKACNPQSVSHLALFAHDIYREILVICGETHHR
ncbi:hypothetical protein H6F88_00305 [Oculatella sp. FACHB-28]|uniref:hypothetical protein n=1 Tax=Cyanophyceae TaxID=3028117 RepID=UPI001683E8A5|nr:MULTISPECIES: hypothetical protein [Cyanophyceae]MBD2054491.1 hypothetical protein [Oculatella sp. FACHB-28]MBD2072075.1 hypothetical protein [Leptolyngbya sp. FACHB-671]